jgi:hypothetical protein
MDKGAWRALFGPTRARRDYKAWRTILIDSPKSMKLKAFPKLPPGRSPSSMDREAVFARELFPLRWNQLSSSRAAFFDGEPDPLRRKMR